MLSGAKKIGFKSQPHSLLTFLTPSPPPIPPLQSEETAEDLSEAECNCWQETATANFRLTQKPLPTARLGKRLRVAVVPDDTG